MKSRSSASLLACRRFRILHLPSAAGLALGLSSPLQFQAHAEAPKAPAWASVMPGNGPRHTLPGPALSPAAAKRAVALALYHKARRLEQEADPAAALPVYQEAARLDPAHPRITRRLIDLHTRAGQLNEALALLEASVDRFPSTPGPLLDLARFLEKQNHGSPELQLRSLRTAETAVRKFPESSAAVSFLVLRHLRDQNRKQAQAVIDRALLSPSRNPGFWLALSRASRNAYPLDDRETYAQHFAIVSQPLEKALTLAPGDPGVLETAGDFFARNRQPDRALALYEKTAALRPGNLKTRQKIGQLLRMAGRDSEAVTLFESLVHIDPADTVSRKALASLHQNSEPEKSLLHRAEILRLESGDPRDYASTATELLQARRPAEALTLVKRGIYFNPGSPQLLYLQARVLTENGDPLSALTSLADAEKLAETKFPRLLDSAFHYSWATVARQAGRIPEAESRYRQSIQKAPKSEPERAAPAYNDLGCLWLSRGENLPAAGELLRTANSLVKDNPAYLDSLGWWHFKTGDYPNALKILRKAASLLPPDGSRPIPELADHLKQAEAAAAPQAPAP